MKLSAATRTRLEQHAGELATAATKQMEAQHEWYRDMPAEDRSWVGLVAHAGINALIAWVREPVNAPAITLDVFGTAPRELTRSITLRHTLDLIRTVIDVVEAEVPTIAGRNDEAGLREAVLTYSREIAFAAAQVYAGAAEARGAWDARLESLVVDAVLRGEADEALRSRVSALGWDEVKGVVVVAGSAPRGPGAESVDALRRAALKLNLDALGTVQGRRLVAVLGRVSEPLSSVRELERHWAAGPLVIGPLVPHLYAAGRSARAALSGHSVASAWTSAPRPCLAEELLPERALLGEGRARRQLIDRVTRPLRGQQSVADTVQTYLDHDSLEATARQLFVHPNTVRYRLSRFNEATGFDVTDARDAYAVRLGLTLARLPS